MPTKTLTSGKRKRAITLKVEMEMLAQVEVLAKQEAVPCSQVLRWALMEYFEHNPITSPDGSQKR